MENLIFFKDGSDYVRIVYSEIVYIEANGKYSTIVTAGKKYLFHSTITAIEERLPSKYFCRVHKSFIISIIHTTSFNHAYAIVSGKKIQIGRQYKTALFSRMIASKNDPGSFIILSDYDTQTLLGKIGFN